MSRFLANRLTKEQQSELRSEFYDIITTLSNKNEVELFFQDLLTLDELAMLMRRIEVATLIRAGFSYRQVSDILGVGKDKIANVQRSLQKDSSGYDIVIQRLLTESGYKKVGTVRSKNSEYERLKRIPYSGLYLFHIIDEIGELLKANFDDTSPKKEQEIVSRMPTRRR